MLIPLVKTLQSLLISLRMKHKAIIMACKTPRKRAPYHCPLCSSHFSHTAVKLNFNTNIHGIWKPLWGGQKEHTKNKQAADSLMLIVGTFFLLSLLVVPWLAKYKPASLFIYLFLLCCFFYSPIHLKQTIVVLQYFDQKFKFWWIWGWRLWKLGTWAKKQSTFGKKNIY